MNHELNKLIGENIRVRRLKLGMNQGDIAAKMTNPVTQQSLTKYEKGTMRIAVDTLFEIARALECQPASLLVKNDDERDSAELKREGKLVKFFRAITTVEGQMSIVKMARAAANIYDAAEDTDE